MIFFLYSSFLHFYAQKCFLDVRTDKYLLKYFLVLLCVCFFKINNVMLLSIWSLYWFIVRRVQYKETVFLQLINYPDSIYVINSSSPPWSEVPPLLDTKFLWMSSSVSGLSSFNMFILVP